MTKKQKRLALVLAAMAASAGAVALVLVALRSTVAYFYTPTELLALDAPPGRVVRLGGLVAPDSVRFGEGQNAEVAFGVTDTTAALVNVRFEGVLPDLFREGQGVVVQGTLGPDGVFEAIEVLAKHDETYMPKELADALKEQGQWKPEEAR